MGCGWQVDPWVAQQVVSGSWVASRLWGLSRLVWGTRQVVSAWVVGGELVMGYSGGGDGLWVVSWSWGIREVVSGL